MRFLVGFAALFGLWRLCWWLIEKECQSPEHFEVVVLLYRAWKRRLKRLFWGNWF